MSHFYGWPHRHRCRQSSPPTSYRIVYEQRVLYTVKQHIVQIYSKNKFHWSESNVVNIINVKKEALYKVIHDVENFLLLKVTDW